MAQVILMHENKTLRDLLALNLQTFAGAEVIVRENAIEAMALLDILPQIQLIVSSKQIGKEETIKELALYLRDRQMSTPLIVMGKMDPALAPEAVVIEDPMNWEMALSKVSTLLGVTIESLSKKVRPDYIAIDALYFYEIDHTPCDVYIKIKKSVGEFHYVKRLHAGDNFNGETIERYLEGGLKQFHIPKETHTDFVTYVSNILVAKLERDDLPIEMQITATAAGFSLAHQEISRLGLSSSTIQLAEAVIGSMIKTIERSPEVGPLLTRILNGTNKYVYQLSHMTSALALEILKAKKIDTEINREKMVYASFFCDLALIDRDDWCRINTFQELDQAGLKEGQWEKVFGHALDGAIFVRKYRELPLGVDTIIKEHHGATHGKGFSVTSFSDIDPLSRIYFICEQVARSLLKYSEAREQKLPVLDQVRNHVNNHPEMLEIISVLQKSFQQKNNNKKG
jgi:hypothetical protein